MAKTKKAETTSTTSAPKTKGIIMPEPNASSEQAFEQDTSQEVSKSNPTLLATSDAVFTMEQIDVFDKACHIIDEAQSKSEGLAEAIASQLYRIDAAELYKIKGYTSMKAFAAERFGIAAGTCSESINTYKRFGIISGDADGIQDKYKDYKFSTLMIIKKLSDDEIERAGIKPTMGRSDIKVALDHLKDLQIEDKQKRTLIERINLLTDNVILHIPAEEFAAEICEKFGEKVRSIMLMSITEIKELMTYVENRLRELDPDNSNLPDLEKESSAVEPEDTSTDKLEENNTVDSVEHTMPTKIIDLALMDEETAISMVKKYLSHVKNHEYDVIITATAAASDK